MKNNDVENFGLALEIISIYLAYLYEHGRVTEIMELKNIRKSVYTLDINTVKKVLDDYGQVMKLELKKQKVMQKINHEINKNDFIKMYVNSENYLLDNNISYNNPTAIIIGGQQGSGKTGIVLKSVKDFVDIGQDMVILDLDAYRGFYKNCFNLMLNYPESYAEITNKYAGKIMESITRKVISHKNNFIFEGTLGKSAYTLELLINSNVKYNILVRVLSVCREESLLSNFERYIKTYNKASLGRFTTIEKHDETYELFTNRLKNIEKKGVVVEVYTRGNEISEPILIYKTENNYNIYENAYEALIEGRKASYYNCMKNVKERLENINNNLVIFQRDKKLYEQLKKLNEIFSYK